MSHIIIIVICVLGMINPSLVRAGTFSTITGKFASIFAEEKIVDEKTLATSQTMTLFKPVVVDGSSTNGAEQNQEQDSLQAVSGPLRVSTEDIDFPTTDIVSVYEVKKGDTLQDVAKLFDVSVNTIMWANNLKSKTITQGETLIILPITGIKHIVKKGDNLWSLLRGDLAKMDLSGFDELSSGAKERMIREILDDMPVPESGKIDKIFPGDVVNFNGIDFQKYLDRQLQK